ncbi:hypothetical protein BT93_L4669 [Corymbia citriodora subsp. variegata]|uniref:Short-chain dehydrogenase n=1 Tax=Corymbia citriodora subsp. variegata TaxID=360336 RepID=A0A8T0CFT1_CORYI|nr:hypothetical protein BT93_L4669 [Corymbia citriodora subsp. variegata]
MIHDARRDQATAQALLRARLGYKVYAIDRQIADGIKSLADATPLHLDVTSSDSMNKFNEEVKDLTLDLYIHATDGSSPAHKDSLEGTDLQVFRKLFAVNTYAPMLITQALVPCLLRSEGAKIVIVTDIMGSIGENDKGGWYAYRSSKAAANALGRALAIDLNSKRVPVFMVHPGSANIEPKATSANNVTDNSSSAEKLWENVIDAKNIADTGKFFDYEGTELSW